VNLLSEERRRLLALKLRERGIDVLHLERRAGLPGALRRQLPRLSFAQQRLWVLDRLEPGNPFYNISAPAELEGPLEVATLARAFAEMARRHESLRTTFGERDGVPYQVIAPPPDPAGWPLAVVDLADLPQAVARREAERLALAEARTSMDLARGPLIRTALVRLGPAAHLLLVTLHHIVSDGWSNSLLLREMAALYEAFAAGRSSPLPEPPLQYADFAEWQLEELRGERLDQEIAWWRERLAGAPAVLELPADRPRPPVQTFAGARLPLWIGAERTAALHRLAREESATLFMLLLAAFGVLLRSWTGQEDLPLGTPVANRRRPELEAIIGFFANTLVLRLDLSGDPTVRELAGRVREVAHDAYAHQDLPFEKLVEELQPERDLARSPLFQVLAVLQNAPPARAALSRLELRSPDLDPGVARFDLMLDLTELEETGGVLRGAFEYSTDLFDAATIERLAERFGCVLEAFTVGPGQRLSDLSLLPEAERRLVAETWAAGPALPAPPSVLDLIAAQAERTPDAVAVVGTGEESLTYRELRARANGLVRHLRSLDLGQGSRIALALDRSLELPIALLGTLQAGAAYVPLDPAWPAERIAFMLEDSRADLLLSLADLDRVEREGGPPLPGSGADDLAYILYTSGSTGRPKGVAMRHGALAQLIAWQAAATPGSWRTLQYSSPSFDVSFQEIASTWAAGGTLVLISEEARRDPAALLARLRDEGIERLFLPFVALQQLAETARGAPPPESLREIVTAGEQLRVTPAIAGLFTRLPGARLHNHYGPSETHVATAFVLEGEPAAWPALPPIGRPVAGARVHVTDLDGRPAPVGAPGELLLGGALLARGYLDQPRLTAERFVPDPFAAEAGTRLYRTGDLARWRSEGALEFLGRLDAQVKIRGYRVEPGEVEAALTAHPAVAAAVVVPREERPGDRRLVAWVVPAAGVEIDPRALRSFVAGRLPEFMVPSEILPTGSLPRTPGGKVDRRALARRTPGPPAAAAEGFVAPRTAIEETLSWIWAEVLGIERVGATDGFFDLGGHSLLGTQVMARVRDALGVELPLRVLFETPRLEDLAGRIEREKRSGAGPSKIQPGSLSTAPGGGRIAPVSFGQHRLWFLDRLDPGSAAYHLPVALRLSGRLHIEALARAFGEIVRRHEAFRTTFAEDGGEPFQIVHPFAPRPPFPLPVVDLTALPPERAREEVDRGGRREAGHPFSLLRGPLLRALLFRLAPDEHVAVTTVHHIVSDGWSMGILVREVGALYGAFVLGRASPLPELPVQVADCAAWQRGALQGERLEELLRWWRQALAGAPQVLDLPSDRPRPPVLSRRGTQRPAALPDALAAGLRAVSRREGATLFMTLLAGLAGVVGRWTGGDDLLIAAPVAGRTRPEMEGLIGFFVNDLALRADLSGDPPFRELVRRVRGMALGAFAHQDLPFERVVEEVLEERSPSHPPLCQIAFAFQNTPRGSLTLPRLVLEPLPVDSGTTKLDLVLSLGEEGSAGPVAGAWEFSTDLFDPPTLERLAGHFRTLLAGAVEDPERPLSELPLLTDSEQAQLAEWNDTGPGETRDFLLQDLFLAWAERQPHAPAVIQDDRSLSYAELRAQAGSLSGRLRALGVGPETRVALCLDETVERIVAVLATLLAGGAWVPLDPAWPRERLAWMLEDSAAPVVLTREGLRSALPATCATVLCLDESQVESLPSLKSLPSLSPTPDHLAYVIYTSGSTGHPNGVMIRHRSVVNLVTQMIGVLGLGPGSRMLQMISFGFDASVLEIWTALGSGAALCIARREARLSGEVLAEEIRRYRITCACLVPSLLAQLPEDGVPDLRVATVGGESCPAGLANRWAPRLRLVSCYGPTEATVLATTCLCTGTDRREPPIGRPLPGARLRVLDRHLRPLPLGVPGALWIAGTGLTRGYRNRPGLTAERFLPDPFSPEPGDRLYRTGDLARLRPDGNLEFLGRLDDQVKIRGVRIEPGEIEAALQSHPDVAEAAVLIREAAGGERRLVAFLASRPGTAPAAAALRAFLRDRLLTPLIPAVFVLLEALPRTPVGKVDRQALGRLAAETSPGEAPARAALRTPTERALAEIWAALLGLSGLSSNDSFFELGGHSLLATRLASRVRERWGIELSLLAVFESPVLAELAARIDRELRAGAPEAPPLLPASRPARPGETRRAPLSFAQSRLWFIDQLEPGSLAYNLPAAVRLSGRLDVAALAGSLDAIARRHETLRTTFEAVQGEPRQVISGAGGGLPLPVVDLSALPAGQREEEKECLVRAEASRPFDLARGPLARCLLLRVAPEEHVLAAVMHHIVSDGWSMGVLVRELGALYAAARAGQTAVLAPLPIQYADFALWQNLWLRGEALESLLGWWRRELEGAPQILDLPTDRPRPPVQTFRGAGEPFALPAGLSAALRELGRREGATPFMVLLAGLQVLLGRRAGQRDLLLGAPVAHRTRAETEPLIGFFVNTLIHRGRLGGDPPFRTFLARVRASSLGAFGHQDLPFERLVEELGAERHRDRTPLYQVLFVLQNAPAAPLCLPGLTLEDIPLAAEAAKTDLLLSLFENPGSGALFGAWEYNTDLFETATIRRLGQSFTALLGGIAADPDLPIGALPLMSGEERHQVLVEWNSTAAAFPRQSSLGELFMEQAARTPAAAALVSDAGETTTWDELERRSARVACHLRTLGVELDERVALVADRSPDLIAGLLGIVRAGGAYLPLDSIHPPERLAWMIADGGARRLLTDGRLLATLPPGTLPSGLQVLSLGAALAGGAPDLAEMPLPTVPAEALACVMYTSGSTGTPKGVAVTHRNVIRLVRGAGYADLGPEQVWLQSAPIAFDASTLEIWVPLLQGGRLALRPEGRASLDGLARSIARHGVTSLWLTAGLFHHMVDDRLEALRPLRQLLAGGDVLSPDHARRLLDALPGLVLIDGYGPTEGTTFTCCHRLTGVEITGAGLAGAPVPIGRPIANARVYVLDTDLQPVPPGAAGELYVGGDGVARGYLGKPDLTAERFVPDPWSGQPGERLYRTGDRVRWREDGVLDFLGRLDGQVKIRGFRVESGGVEAALARHPAVRQAAVVARDGVGGKILTAWVTLSEPLPSPVSEIQLFLREWLPEPMIPTAWVFLDELPLTANGKVDRRALPAHEATHERRDRGQNEPRTPLERDIVDICSEVLGVERVGLHDNFFALGGHSLLAAQLAARLSDRLQMEIPLSLLFDAEDLGDLAERITMQELARVDEADMGALLDEIQDISPEEMRELLAAAKENG
jgi:amino acid adenylation domain-containing protein